MRNYRKFIFTMLLLSLSFSGFSQRYTSEIFSYLNIEVDTGIVYGQNYEVIGFTNNVQLVDLKLDVYQPLQSEDTVSERPLMIYLHTGNFLPPPTNGSPTGLRSDLTAREICRQFAKRGYVAASISYRLGWLPLSNDADVRRGSLLRAVFRAIVDAKTAVRYFRREYAENNNPYNIDTSKVMILGEGSGGYVALAFATLDKFSEVTLPKFLNAQNEPVIDTNVIGNFEGFGGTENFDNHVGYSAEAQLISNLGGALADTSWMEPGDAPMVAFHCPRDPFAPYLDGTVVVPTTNENVVDVQGSGVFTRKAVDLGNNDVFVNANLNDPISQLARSKYDQTIDYWSVARPTISTAGDEGLYPFLLPLQPQQFQNQSSPWQFWNPFSDLAQATPPGGSTSTHESSLQSNPDMSRDKAIRYIDTIQWYLQPRAVLALGLDTTETYNDPLAGAVDSATILGLIEIGLKEVDMDIYPNPATSNVVLNLNDTQLQMEAYEIYGLNGKMLARDRVVDNGRLQINRGGLSDGIYLINIRYADGRNSVHKVMFE